MDDGLAVAVQIEDDVGVDREAEEGEAQRLDLGLRDLLGHRPTHGGADAHDVVARLGAELTVDLGGHGVG